MTSQPRAAITFDAVGLPPPLAAAPPISFALNPGEWAVWTEPDPALAQAYLSLALGLADPAQGRVRWFGEPRPGPTEIWGICDFRRRLGYVAPNGRLISGRDLLDNLTLYYEYVLGHDRLKALEEAWAWLEKLELAEAAEIMGEEFPERLAPLALLALNLAKEPDIFFLERPKRLFEKDFERVWAILEEQKLARNLALLVFDRQPGLWRTEIADGLAHFSTAALSAPKGAP